MTTVADIMEFMEALASGSLKMDWDNAGLNCGDPTAPVAKILVALDPFEQVCREAAQWGADLLVTHHPLIFHPLKSVTNQTAITRGLMTLIQNHISHFCAHTNLDIAPGGVNDVLAGTLGLGSITPVEGDSENLLRRGTLPEQPLTAFLPYVKKLLKCDGLRYVDGGRPVRNVAVGGGACAESLYTVAASGCDTFVTSDIKYNQFWDAKDLGLNLIDAGHFHTENPVCAMLAAKIAAAFPAVEVKISEIHTDCMKYY